MSKAQHGILRFHKYKGPEIGQIEAHNERTKEKYASNPDIDPARKHLNYNLLTPPPQYRAEAEQQIREAGCRTRKDSVRLVETLITASPEFFQNKSQQEIRAYFERALEFMKTKQNPDTFVSAVVHMDEKTPHMHLSFVPLTKDKRLSAKEILGNKKKLTQWQDSFWKYMVDKYPELERGESASLTGRTHIPTRLYKEAIRLQKQQERLTQLLADIHPLNAKKRATEIEKLLGKYLPAVEKMATQLKQYDAAYKQLKAEADIEKLSVKEQMEIARKLSEYEVLRSLTEKIPQEILEEYSKNKTEKKQEEISYD
jgi:hypothetical protein